MADPALDPGEDPAGTGPVSTRAPAESTSDVLDSTERATGTDEQGPSRPVLPVRYEDLGPLARGAFGEVRRVRDTRLDRVLAMKLLHAHMAARPAVRRRFFIEVATTAELQHPGIIPIYEHGELACGRLWYTMKEVRGVTLGSVLADLHAPPPHDQGRPGSPLGPPLRRVIDAFARIAQTVAYAHRAGFVHRDLKPANLMIGEFGEVLVMDWGLARRTARPDEPGPEDARDALEEDQSPDLTRLGDVLGTPAYMPPEQARGARDLHGPASDVYALGAILCHVLSGHPPHGEAAPEGVGLPVELVAACRRAMQPVPADRGTAEDLATDVLAWLDGARKREQALVVLGAAHALGPAITALWSQAARAEAAAKALEAGIRPFSPIEQKRPVWALEDEAAARAREAALAEARWLQIVHGALSVDAELPEAHAMLADHYRAQLAEAGRTHRGADAARFEAMLRAHDRGQHAAFLRGEVHVSLVTLPPGASVSLHRYRLVDRRLVPVFERDLGTTPLCEVPIQHGSCLLVIRAEGHVEVRYPVLVERDGHWDGVPPGASEPRAVVLPRATELGADDVCVPSGWTLTGGDPLAPDSLPLRRIWVDAFVVRRHPVTNGEYLAFLNDLLASGREAEALAACPRKEMGTVESDAVALAWERGASGRFVLPPDAWQADGPVVQVDWHAGSAYARWLAQRTGEPWRLPNELEREKAARGADGRAFAWGDHGDATFACVLEGHRGVPGREPVGDHPSDESPFGVRGLTGNVRDWCVNLWRPDGPLVVGDRLQLDAAAEGDTDFRAIRGGFWGGPLANARSASRYGSRPGVCRYSVGFRLVRALGRG